MWEGDTLEATVIPDGRFVLANVPHGPLVLMVGSRPGRQAKASDAERLFAVVRTVVSRNMGEQVVQMNPGSVFSGTVKFASTNATPPPSGKVFIGLRGAGATPLGEELVFGPASDIDGRFASVAYPRCVFPHGHRVACAMVNRFGYP